MNFPTTRLLRWATLTLAGVALAACAAPVTPVAAIAVDPAQSIIFHNGAILTMNTGQPSVEALAIQGEKIVALGSEAEILARQAPGTIVIDLAGRTLMPGFVDAHTHILNDARADGRSLDQAQSLALSNGITTLGDLYVDEPFLREMRAFAQSGALRVRTSLYLVANTNCGRGLGGWFKKYLSPRQPGEMLRIGGVKIFTDGGSCGGVALSFELEPGQGQGDLWLTQAELNRMVAEAQAGGYQAAIHAIGDRAVGQAQTAIALALDGGPNLYRHRLEHVSVLRPEFVPRFGELGIVPVLNGQYPACTPFGPPLPSGYHAWEWPWRELRDANPALPIAWHSDYPFLSGNPFVHLYGFVTRTDVFQSYTCPAADWLRDDTLSVPEALSVMTLGSAYALFRDEEVGSLQPGKYADVIVISDNPLTVSPASLKGLSVLATMVGGRFEYCSPRFPELCPGYQQRQPVPLPDFRPAVPIRWLMLVLVVALPLGVGFWTRAPAARAWRLRLSGAAGLLGGALWVWVWAWSAWFGSPDSSGLTPWAMLAAPTFLAIALLGQARLQSPTRLSGLGLAAAWLGLVSLATGSILNEWFNLEASWFLIYFGVLTHTIGLIVIGLANLLAKRRSPLYWLPLMMGVLGGAFPLALSMVIAESNWPALIVGYGLGLGWMLMGLLILNVARAIDQPPAS